MQHSGAIEAPFQAKQNLKKTLIEQTNKSTVIGAYQAGNGVKGGRLVQQRPPDRFSQYPS